MSVVAGFDSPPCASSTQRMKVEAMLIETDNLVTCGQIAEMYNISNTTVSNWRNRYVGFPHPTWASVAADFFDREQVKQWHAEQFGTKGESVKPVPAKYVATQKGLQIHFGILQSSFSNWSKADIGFPEPLDYPLVTTRLYDIRAVERWLRRKGYDVPASA